MSFTSPLDQGGLEAHDCPKYVLETRYATCARPLTFDIHIDFLPVPTLTNETIRPLCVG